MDKNEQIRARAYQIWEQEGRPHGRHDEHWRQAVEEIGGDTAEAAGAAPHPGMMGDGSEEQSLNQAGTPSARITQGEVNEAFASASKK